jgi:hypothetical protein
MLYTVIAEARTGGSHLVESMRKYTGFKLASEPWGGSPNRFSKTKTVENVDWIKNYDNLFIKEIYDSIENYDNLINISDKVLCLYRENWYSQAKSILYARRFDEWQFSYKKSHVDEVVSDEEIYKLYYNGNLRYHKWDFKQFIKKNNLPSISYEELYYNNGMEKIKKIFDFGDEFEFPIYERHLKNDDYTSVGFEPIPEEPQDLKYLRDLFDRYFNEREQIHIMYNSLIKQQEINEKLFDEIRKLKEK